MNRQASILFNFISSSISGNWLARQESSAPHSYYQQLIYTSLARNLYTIEGFQSLGRQLATIAHQAYFARQMDAVEQASQVMLALPISKELKAAAHYYQAIHTKRKGDFDGARRLLEYVVEEATPQYKARVLHTIGTTYFDSGKIETSVPFFLVAGQTASECDPLTWTASQKMIAVIRSINGDHKQALTDLKRLFPIVRALGNYYPALYYDYLNSLAVELGEVGRLDEAQAACSIALASPFALAYPEFAQTRDELEAKRTAATPSVVAINLAPEPVTAPQTQTARQAKPVCRHTFIWLVHANRSLQISRAIATAAIAVIGTTQSILDQVRFCIQPRGPPTHC